MVADAAAAAEWYTSFLRHYIDHASSLAQCHSMIGRIPNKIQHGHPSPVLCNRIYYGASFDGGTSVRRPFAPMRIGRTLTGSTEPTTCVLDPVKTAMEKRQSRKRERYWRQTLRPRSRHIRWHIMCLEKKSSGGKLFGADANSSRGSMCVPPCLWSEASMLGRKQTVCLGQGQKNTSSHPRPSQPA